MTAPINVSRRNSRTAFPSLVHTTTHYSMRDKKNHWFEIFSHEDRFSTHSQITNLAGGFVSVFGPFM